MLYIRNMSWLGYGYKTDVEKVLSVGGGQQWLVMLERGIKSNIRNDNAIIHEKGLFVVESHHFYVRSIALGDLMSLFVDNLQCHYARCWDVPHVDSSSVRQP